MQPRNSIHPWHVTCKLHCNLQGSKVHKNLEEKMWETGGILQPKEVLVNVEFLFSCWRCVSQIPCAPQPNFLPIKEPAQLPQGAVRGEPMERPSDPAPLIHRRQVIQGAPGAPRPEAPKKYPLPFYAKG